MPWTEYAMGAILCQERGGTRKRHTDWERTTQGRAYATRALDSISVDGIAATAKVTRDGEGRDSTTTFLTENLTAGIASPQGHQPWVDAFSVASIDSVLGRGYGYDSTPGRLKEMNWRNGTNMYLRRFRYATPGDLSWLQDLSPGFSPVFVWRHAPRVESLRWLE
jgi:hypothetical protein